jgi:transcriptional regulator with XRE-family HTH domain
MRWTPWGLAQCGLPLTEKSGPRFIRECFGDAVRLRREELELTQEELAASADIHRTYLSDVQRGSRNISLVNIEKLAQALSLRISELFQRLEQ